MGKFKIQFVVVVTYDFKQNKEVLEKLNNLVRLNPKLFTKSQVMTNSFINYVMFFDGSKELWSESDKANILRKRFVALAKKLWLAEIYEVNREEDSEPTLIHTKVVDKNE